MFHLQIRTCWVHKGTVPSAGRQDRTSTAATELMLGKETGQTRPTSNPPVSQLQQKVRFLSRTITYKCSHLPLHPRKGEMHTATHKALGREWKKPRGATERWSKNAACKESKGNTSLRAETRSLATYVGLFCPRSSPYHKPGQLRGQEVRSNHPYVRRMGGLRARNKQWLPWEVPSSQDGQGEHPAEPGWATTPSQGRATPRQVPQLWVASEALPTLPLCLAASRQTADFICLNS